jgi:hypothetical protein
MNKQTSRRELVKRVRVWAWAWVKFNGGPAHYTGPLTQRRCILFFFILNLNFRAHFRAAPLESAHHWQNKGHSRQDLRVDAHNAATTAPLYCRTLDAAVSHSSVQKKTAKEEWRLLGSCAVRILYKPTFRRNISSPSSE